MMHRTIGRMVVAVMAFALIAAAVTPRVLAARSNASPVTITVWTVYSHAQLDAFTYLMNQFMARNPDIKVQEVSAANYGALLQKEQSAIFAGNTPTLGQMYEEWGQQFLQSSALEPLDSYVSNKKIGLSKAEIADYWPALWKDGFLGKHMYLMPFSKSTEVFYFDRNILKQHGIKNPPNTWNQFASDCKKLTTGPSGAPSTWCTTFGVDASPWYIWETEWGVPVLDKHNKASFGNARGAAPVSFFAGLVKKHQMVVSTSANFQDQADFDAGKTAFDIGTSAGLPFFLSGAKPGVAVGVSLLPAGPKKRATELFGAPLGMFKNASAAEKQAGWLFMKYLTSPGATAYWAIHTGYMPVRKSALKIGSLKTYYRQNPQAGRSLDQLKYAVLEPQLVGWTKARSDIASNLAAGLQGSKSPLDAMRSAAQQVDNDLSQK